MSDEHEARDGAEIIDIGVYRKAGSVVPMLTVKPRKGWCIACYFEFDEKERTVECSKCGRNWEAFDALMQLADKWRSYATNCLVLRQECDALAKERDQLRKEVANLKASKRRADDVVTALLSALSKRRNAALNVPRDRREWGEGYDAGVRAVVEFIKNGSWRKDGSQ